MKKLLLFFCISGFAAFRLTAQQSINVAFYHDSLRVYGTLTIPAGTGPFPTIIIDPGSGPNDRNGTLVMAGGTGSVVPCLYPNLLNDTLRPYKQLAESLTDSGYMVLRYDKIEYTYTTPSALGAITFHKLWLPVESAVKYLKTRTETDTTQIILIGHSEGSYFIPYIANNLKDIKALISLAGPRTPFDTLLAYQLVHFAQLCHGDTATAKTQASQVLGYFNTIRTNTWNGSTPAFAGASASTWYDYIRVVDSVAINYNSTGVPTLFAGMGSDNNVPPSELARFETDITPGRCLSFVSVPGLIHYMTNLTNPNISPSVPDTIVNWLRHQCAPSGIDEPHVSSGIKLGVYPNPFSSTVTITINEMQAPAPVKLNISDLSGRIFYLLSANENRDFSKTLSLEALPAGIYFIEVQAGSERTIGKMVKQ